MYLKLLRIKYPFKYKGKRECKIRFRDLSLPENYPEYIIKLSALRNYSPLLIYKMQLYFICI